MHTGSADANWFCSNDAMDAQVAQAALNRWRQQHRKRKLHGEQAFYDEAAKFVERHAQANQSVHHKFLFPWAWKGHLKQPGCSEQAKLYKDLVLVYGSNDRNGSPIEKDADIW